MATPRAWRTNNGQVHAQLQTTHTPLDRHETSVVLQSGLVDRAGSGASLWVCVHHLDSARSHCKVFWRTIYLDTLVTDIYFSCAPMPPSNSNNGGNNATPPRQPIQRAERVRNQRRVRPPQSGNMGTVKRSLEYAFDRQAAKQRFTPVLNELLKRYRAAVKIQSAVRGMLSRHEVYKPFGIAYYAGHKRFYTTAVAQAAQAAHPRTLHFEGMIPWTSPRDARSDAAALSLDCFDGEYKLGWSALMA